MALIPQRAPLAGPTFIRLLARVADAAEPGSGAAPGERLGQWIDWNRAVALSSALDGRLPPADAARGVDPAADEGEVARVRATLVEAIATGLPDPDPATAADYAPFRQHAQAMQRAMQVATGRLRGPLRDRLGARSPGLARLAEVDAVMELTLGPREHRLLARVPALLGDHFERLRPAVPAGAGLATHAPAPGAWLDLFRRDMQGVLLAELDVRFQPIEALLAALRTS